MPGDQTQHTDVQDASRPGSDSPGDDRFSTTRVRLELPNATIIKVLVTLVLIWLFLQISGTLFVIFMGLLLALVFERPVSWLSQRWLPRGIAIAVVLGAVIGVFTLLLVFLIPPLVDDVQGFLEELPTYVEEGLAWLQSRQPGIYDAILSWAQAQQQGISTGGLDLEPVLTQGLGLVTNVVNIVIALVVMVYFLADQGRTFDTFFKLLPEPRKSKAERTFPAVAKVVNGYVVGQSVNSTLFALFSLIVLTALDVPSVGVLVLIAFVGDAIPQVGATLATIPAVLLAATVSIQTGLIILVAYLLYQGVENYITSPRVFGKTLDLPPLITMTSVLIGGSLMGVIGVLLALPVAAAIPVIARIWWGENASDTDELHASPG